MKNFSAVLTVIFLVTAHSCSISGSGRLICHFMTARETLSDLAAYRPQRPCRTRAGRTALPLKLSLHFAHPLASRYIPSIFDVHFLRSVTAKPTPTDDAKPHKRALKRYNLNGYVIRGRGPCNSNEMLFLLCTASPTFPRNMATPSTQLNLPTNVAYLDLVHVVAQSWVTTLIA